eukprot:54503_1
MAHLATLIKFRQLNEQLTQEEYEQFLIKAAGLCPRNFIISSIFNQFNNNRNTVTDTQQIDVMNNIMHEIIESREPETNNEKEDIIPINIEYLPKYLIGEIGSFLNQKCYSHFSQCNRTIYINCNKPKTLQHIHIKSKSDYKSINFSEYPMLKQITFKIKSIEHKILINMDKPTSLINSLLNTQLAIVRDVSMLILKSVIYKINSNYNTVRKFQLNTIISLMIGKLTKALEIASDQNLIDNSNDSFPDDLKSYTERMPKLDKFLRCLIELLQLFPTQIIPQLIHETNWCLLCKIFAALERGAGTFQWAKNDDKLLTLQLMTHLIDKSKQPANTFFNDEFIETLTEQLVVSTRSKIVSPYMNKIVSITYNLLTYFAGI